MGKKVCRYGKIEIRADVDSEWVDISSFVTRWGVIAGIEELYEVELDLHYDHNKVRVEPGWMNEEGRKQIAVDDTIVLFGVDVSDHVPGYVFEVEVGEVVTLELRYQADADTIRINGEAVWENEPARPGDQEDLDGQKWLEDLSFELDGGKHWELPEDPMKEGKR